MSKTQFTPDIDAAILARSITDIEIARSLARSLGRGVKVVQRRRRHLLAASGVAKPTRQNVTPHPQATLDRIRELRSAGETYLAIAMEIGMTRSAVASLVSRHCRDIKVVRRVGQPAEVVKVEVVKVEKPKPAPVPVAPPVFSIVSNPVPFSAATGCRWPLWSTSDALPDKVVCGASCGTDTYCAGHAALAYRSPEKRRAA